MSFLWPVLVPLSLLLVIFQFEVAPRVVLQYYVMFLNTGKKICAIDKASFKCDLQCVGLEFNISESTIYFLNIF